MLGNHNCGPADFSPEKPSLFELLLVTGELLFGRPAASEIGSFMHLTMGSGENVHKDEDPTSFASRVKLMHSVLSRHFSDRDRQNVFYSGMPSKIRKELTSWIRAQEDEILNWDRLVNRSAVVHRSLQAEEADAAKYHASQPRALVNMPAKETPAKRNAGKTTYHCQHHGWNTSHETRDCNILNGNSREAPSANRRAPDAVSFALAGTNPTRVYNQGYPGEVHPAAGGTARDPYPNRNRDRSNGGKDPSTPRCPYCGVLGHLSDSCWIRHPGNAPLSFKPSSEALMMLFHQNGGRPAVPAAAARHAHVSFLQRSDSEHSSESNDDPFVGMTVSTSPFPNGYEFPPNSEVGRYIMAAQAKRASKRLAAATEGMAIPSGREQPVVIRNRQALPISFTQFTPTATVLAEQTPDTTDLVPLQELSPAPTHPSADPQSSLEPLPDNQGYPLLETLLPPTPPANLVSRVLSPQQLSEGVLAIDTHLSHLSKALKSLLRVPTSTAHNGMFSEPRVPALDALDIPDNSHLTTTPLDHHKLQLVHLRNQFQSSMQTHQCADDTLGLTVTHPEGHVMQPKCAFDSGATLNLVSKEFVLKHCLPFSNTDVCISNSTHASSHQLAGEVKAPLEFVLKRGSPEELRILVKVYVSDGLGGICDFLIGTPFLNACGGYVKPMPGVFVYHPFYQSLGDDRTEACIPVKVKSHKISTRASMLRNGQALVGAVQDSDPDECIAAMARVGPTTRIGSIPPDADNPTLLSRFSTGFCDAIDAAANAATHPELEDIPLATQKQQDRIVADLEGIARVKTSSDKHKVRIGRPKNKSSTRSHSSTFTRATRSMLCFLARFGFSSLAVLAWCKL